jgi:hypothetical protein
MYLLTTLFVSSTTSNWLVVVPIGNVEPLGKPADNDTFSPAQRLFVVGALYDTTASHSLVVTVTAAGQLIDGGLLLLTVTSKLHDAKTTK